MTWALRAIGKDLGPVLEGAVGGDGGGAAVVVALGDDLEGELGLGGVHGEDGEVVDDEELGSDVAAEGAFEGAVKLGAGELVEHLRGADEDDAPAGRLAGLVGERAGEEGLAGAGGADEERVDSRLEEAEVVESEVASAELLAAGSKSKLKASMVLISGKRASRRRRSTALPMRLCFSSSQRRWMASSVVRLFFGARSSRASSEARHAGSLKPAELVEEHLGSSKILRFFIWRLPGSRVICGRAVVDGEVGLAQGDGVEAGCRGEAVLATGRGRACGAARTRRTRRRHGRSASPPRWREAVGPRRTARRGG